MLSFPSPHPTHQNRRRRGLHCSTWCSRQNCSPDTAHCTLAESPEPSFLAGVTADAAVHVGVEGAMAMVEVRTSQATSKPHQLNSPIPLPLPFAASQPPEYLETRTYQTQFGTARRYLWKVHLASPPPPELPVFPPQLSPAL